MRILATTDLHYRLPHYDWLVRAAADVDVVAITGDLADVVNPVPMGVQVVVLDNYLRLIAERATLLVASGNHDLDGPGADGEQVAGWLRRPMTDRVHADGASVDIDGTRFTVCPWWDGPLTRESSRRPAGGGRPRPTRTVGLALPLATRWHRALPRRPPGVPRP